MIARWTHAQPRRARRGALGIVLLVCLLVLLAWPQAAQAGRPSAPRHPQAGPRPPGGASAALPLAPDTGSIAPDAPSLSPDALAISQTLTLNSNDFAAGRFGLTGLAQSGGVQLVPLGVLRRWLQHPEPLCRPLAYMATAVFKQHLYAVGGATIVGDGGGGTQAASLKEVCRTTVTAANGASEPWTTVPAENLPAPRRSLAAVAVAQPNDPSRGFLYAMGGLYNSTTSQSDLIWRAGINPDGSLTGWVTETLRLPNPRQGLASAAFTTEGGKTYIYVIGGYQKPFVPTYAYRDVLRYEVSSTGALIDRSSGVPAVPIPGGVIAGAGSCEDKVGIKDADALAMDVATTDDAGSRAVLMLVGGIFQLGSGDASGCTPGAVVSARVFMAEIDRETGDLAWQTGPTQEYTLPEPLSGTQAVGINSKIYAAGGLLGVDQTSATNNTYTSHVEVDDLTLPNYGPTSNFLLSTSAMDNDEKRGGHGMEIIQVPAVNQQGEPYVRPIVFLFGGTDGLGGYRSDALYGFVGHEGDTEVEGDYASLGVYTSPPYQLNGAGAITELRWNAAISTTGAFTTDIKLQFRLAPNATGLPSAAWMTVDANPDAGFFSVNGQNIATSAVTATGSFVQYRAFLSTSMPGDRAATPVLRGPVAVKYTVDGHPSLYVKAASFPPIVAGGAPSATIRLANNTPPNSTSTENVLNANIEGPRTLFVDLYLYPPGTAVVTPTRDPLTGAYALTSAAYAEISAAALPAGNEIVVSPNLWKLNCGPPWNCPAVQWNMLFGQPGTWNVIAIIDSQNAVTEADDLDGEWERDNLLRFTVNSQVDGSRLAMPVIIRSAPPGLAAPPPMAVRPSSASR